MSLFAIHSTARGRANRTARASAPMHRGIVQWVGPQQTRLLIGRPLIWTEEQVMGSIHELRQKAAAGSLEVRTADGRRVDLATMQVATAAPSLPLPNPPLDSAANDSPHIGQNMPQFQGGIPVMQASVDELAIPSEFLAPEGADDSELEIDFKPQQGNNNNKKGRR